MLGIGKGKIDIIIPKTYYAPGDIISGNVSLTLKKPAKAKQLSISLIGEYKSTTRQVGPDGHVSRSSHTSKIHDFEL